MALMEKLDLMMQASARRMPRSCQVVPSRTRSPVDICLAIENYKSVNNILIKSPCKC